MDASQNQHPNSTEFNSTAMKKFECNVCGYKTTSKAYLKVHVDGVHLKVKRHTCDKCDYTTSYKSDLNLHNKKPHVTCDICFMVVTKLLMHKRRVHKGFAITKQKCKKKFQCDKCDHVSVSQEGLKGHMKKPHIKCEICSLVTTNPVEHMRKNHKHAHQQSTWLGKLTSWKMKNSEFDLMDENAEELKCNKCEHVAKSQKGLEEHMEKPHIKCEICLLITTDQEGHMQRNHEFANKESIRPGKYKPSKQGKLKCDMCDYEAAGTRYLSDHINIVHLKTDMFKCEKCIYKTASKENYNNHVRTPHDKCEVCQLVDTRNMIFRHKKKLGHGIKVYKCNKCSFTTTEKENMLRHDKIIHVKDKYKCDKCDYEAPSKSNYSHHKSKLHITCEMCEFVTTNENKLKRHKISWHTVENSQYKVNGIESKKPPNVGQQLPKQEVVENTDSNYLPSTKPTSQNNDSGTESEYWTFNGLQCEICAFFSKSTADLRKHMALNHCHESKQPNQAVSKQESSLQCKLCPFLSSSKQGLTTHMATHLKGQMSISLPCQYCDFVATGKKVKKVGQSHKYDEIVSHIKDNHPDMAAINKCDLCEYVAFNKKLLHAHRNSQHLSESDRQCPNCDFYTVFLRDMSHHKKDVHNIAFNFVCKTCGKDFVSLSVLISHKKVHNSDANMFQCPLCNDSLKSRDPGFKNHLKNMHEEDQINKKCTICDFEGEYAF